MEYMSKECYDELVAELQQLVKVELPKAKDELSEARAKGDLSENFEYHAAKRASLSSSLALGSSTLTSCCSSATSSS